ncbi:hypothetical protein CDCA_CDCA05G1714 [Cyanidium caldarium]|uniref:Small-subunit processome Utp12 domain-containing protein n=1 Tax=Cyanidium caldarium TaxID=2771 RepID=A0AAV9ITX0_CYACA|nr:hypothetical protein CDCA_CDCA05G1714 [Cyanidium caldarium]
MATSGGENGALRLSRRGKGAYVSAAPVPYVQRAAATGPGATRPLTHMVAGGSAHCHGQTRRRQRVHGDCTENVEPEPIAPLYTAMGWSDGRLVMYEHTPSAAQDGVTDADPLDTDCVPLRTRVAAQWHDDPTLSGPQTTAQDTVMGAGAYVGRLTAMQCVAVPLDGHPLWEQRSRAGTIKRRRRAAAESNARGAVDAPVTPSSLLLLVTAYESGWMRVFYWHGEANHERETAARNKTGQPTALRLADALQLDGGVSAMTAVLDPQPDGQSAGVHVPLARVSVYVAGHDASAHVHCYPIVVSVAARGGSAAVQVRLARNVPLPSTLHLAHWGADPIHHMAVSPGGGWMAVASAVSGAVGVARLPRAVSDTVGDSQPTASTANVWRLAGHASAVSCLQFVAPHVLISGCTGDAFVCLWRLPLPSEIDAESMRALHAPWKSALCGGHTRSVVQVAPLRWPADTPFEAESPTAMNGDEASCRRVSALPNADGQPLSNGFHDVHRNPTSDAAAAAGDGAFVAVGDTGEVHVFSLSLEDDATPGAEGMDGAAAMLPRLVLRAPRSGLVHVAVLSEVQRRRVRGLPLFYGTIAAPAAVLLRAPFWREMENGVRHGETRVQTLPDASDAGGHGDKSDDVAVEAKQTQSGHTEIAVLSRAAMPLSEVDRCPPVAMASAERRREGGGHDDDTTAAVTEPTMGDRLRQRKRQDSNGDEDETSSRATGAKRRHALLPESSHGDVESASPDETSIDHSHGAAMIPTADRGASATVPSVGSVARVIHQAVTAADAKLLESALSSVRTPTGIRRTVRHLSLSDAVPLMRALTERFRSAPARVPQVTQWIRALIAQHASLWRAQRQYAPPSNEMQDMRDTVQLLYRSVEERVQLANALARLEGRLELILQQAPRCMSTDGEAGEAPDIATLRWSLEERRASGDVVEDEEQQETDESSAEEDALSDVADENDE